MSATNGNKLFCSLHYCFADKTGDCPVTKHTGFCRMQGLVRSLTPTLLSASISHLRFQIQLYNGTEGLADFIIERHSLLVELENLE